MISTSTNVPRRPAPPGKFTTRLFGVRLDTSETLVDQSIVPQMGLFKPTGVNPQLVWNVRRALDEVFRRIRGEAAAMFAPEGLLRRHLLSDLKRLFSGNVAGEDAP